MSWFDDLVEWASAGGADDALSGADVSLDDIVGSAENLFDTSDYVSNNGSPMYGLDSPSPEPEYQSNNGNPMYGSDFQTESPNDPKEILVKDDNSYQSNNGSPMYGPEGGKINIADKLSGGKEAGMFDKATGFIDKNKKLADMGLGLIGGMYSSSQKKKEDNKAYERMLEKRAYDEKIQKEKEDRADARRGGGGGGGGGSSAMEMLAAKEAIDAANKAKFSASITGLRPPGLINKGKKLTYVGGKPVYTDNGNLK